MAFRRRYGRSRFRSFRGRRGMAGRRRRTSRLRIGYRM